MYEELVKRLREESEIERWLQPHSANETPKLLDDAADAIEELTNRNVGKWEVDEAGCAICSVCRNYAFETTTHHISGWYPRFCPNCGAQMIGGDDDV